ncbi:hypothetical protein [Sorangium atrum]|uniref:Peptidase M10 metallopeptidase domain-containing protein n=1 Tax=Sorangium atrum TaxID=2995308 RepID=A0ABT5BPY6_9BACT|nr:hypothetical protein [Sorangium aterium]MDC0676219.1 hypothetical protein [Sorangium aterium]
MSTSLAPASSAIDPSRVDGKPGGERRATRMRGGGLLAAGALAALVAGACGGRVVVDGFEPPPDGTGGTGGSWSSGDTTSAAPQGSSGAGQGGSIGEGGAPPIPPLVKEEHNNVGVDGSIPVIVQPGTLGFTAVAEIMASSPSFDPIGIESIRGPDGRLLAADYTIPGTMAAFFNQGIGTAAVPQTGADASSPLAPGVYWVKLGNGGAGPLAEPARLTVWHRQTLDGRFHGGKIDINVFIAGDAVSEQYMRRVLTSAYEGYVGLGVGSINVHHIGSEWEFVDEEVLPGVLEQTAGAPGRPALNVIAVTAFGGSLAQASGVTPAVPAVAVEHGTHLSGIVVTLYEEPSVDTVILRHELGHLAGLFHTTEFDADFGDPLDDTSQCSDVNALMERCPDFGNLMFPTGGDFSGALTPQQTTIVRASALYRGIVEQGGGAAVPLPADADTPASGAPIAPPAPGERARSFAPDRLASTAALPPHAAALLAGHFCGQSAARGADFDELLRAAGGADPDRLLAVGRDPGAPAYMRARALTAAGRAAARSSASARVIAELQALAADPRLPRRARLGAVEGVASASPAAARALAARLTGDADRVVERTATRAAR